MNCAISSLRLHVQFLCHFFGVVLIKMDSFSEKKLEFKLNFGCHETKVLEHAPNPTTCNQKFAVYRKYVISTRLLTSAKTGPESSYNQFGKPNQMRYGWTVFCIPVL